MTTTTTIAKTACPLTAEEFLDHAKPLRITVEDGTPVAEGATTGGERVLIGEPKQFNTGSFGYYATGKLDCLVNGVPQWHKHLRLCHCATGQAGRMP